MRIALLTRSYPSDEALYQYPFVHRRVVAYQAAGHAVKVMRLGNVEGRHCFDGVECHTLATEHFAAAVAEFSPDVVAVHGPDENIWPAVTALGGVWPVCAWLHGSEIPAFFREKARRIVTEPERSKALAAVEARAVFWRTTLSPWPGRLDLALVSDYSIELMREDLAGLLCERRITVIPNPIDTELFAYRPKTAGQRKRILSIRPYDSPTYGNDLAVSAVLALADHPAFDTMHFTFVGDGPMFDTVLEPLRGFSNVEIQRRFLRQADIAVMHRDAGIFLVPTRLDTQGVSRDEAMASGLVSVTNAVCAIPEYTDDSCAGLARADDALGLAREIAALVDDPGLFLARSAAAAARVRRQSAHAIIIPRELAWMERCRDARN